MELKSENCINMGLGLDGNDSKIIIKSRLEDLAKISTKTGHY